MKFNYSFKNLGIHMFIGRNFFNNQQVEALRLELSAISGEITLEDDVLPTSDPDQHDDVWLVRIPFSLSGDEMKQALALLNQHHYLKSWGTTIYAPDNITVLS